MGIVLGGFVLAMLAVGFAMLMALPLLFIWLAISVYTEPWAEAGGVLGGRLPAEPEEIESMPEPETERPRTMVAGRRGRPL